MKININFLKKRGTFGKSAQEKDSFENHQVDFFENKKAQEEMVGFALIMIIVMIIVLIILGFALTRSKGVEEKDFQLTGFIEASLQVTTDCKFNDEFLTIRGMVHQCNQRQKCD